MSAIFGHGHPEIVAVVENHIKSLTHLNSGFVSPPVVSLARSLAELLPPGLEKVMLLSTGGESNEAAIKVLCVLCTPDLWLTKRASDGKTLYRKV